MHECHDDLNTHHQLRNQPLNPQQKDGVQHLSGRNHPAARVLQAPYSDRVFFEPHAE